MEGSNMAEIIYAIRPNRSYVNQSHGLGKLGHQGAICWLKKELSMVHGTLNIFFRNKTFLFVKIEI